MVFFSITFGVKILCEKFSSRSQIIDEIKKQFDNEISSHQKCEQISSSQVKIIASHIIFVSLDLRFIHKILRPEDIKEGKKRSKKYIKRFSRSQKKKIN